MMVKNNFIQYQDFITKIEKNYIIIDLTYEEEEINNGETVTIKKVYDKYVNDESTVINLDNLELAY